MPLKFRVQKIEEVVDEAIRAFYKEVEVPVANGTAGQTAKVFQLDVEGVAAPERVTDLNTKLNVFRKTNGRLAERLKVFAEQSGVTLEDDMTPEDLAEILKDKAEEAKKALEKLKSGGSEEVEKQVAARVEAMKTTHAAELKKAADLAAKAAKDRDDYLRQLEKVMVENSVLEAATKRGLRATAHEDIVSRARRVFSFKEGKVRALSEDGETPRYGADGTNELTISEWVEAQASKDGVHLFEGNSGGGAAGGSGGAGRGGGPGPNPFKKESWDLTRQMELLKKDPATARRLAKEAGRNIPELAAA